MGTHRWTRRERGIGEFGRRRRVQRDPRGRVGPHDERERAWNVVDVLRRRTSYAETETREHYHGKFRYHSLGQPEAAALRYFQRRHRIIYARHGARIGAGRRTY